MRFLSKCGQLVAELLPEELLLRLLLCVEGMAEVYWDF